METHYEARMKEWITDHDILQKTLAKEFHVTEAMMSHYMTGKHEITVDVLYKFAKRTGLSADYLLGFIDEPIPPTQLTKAEHQLVECFRALSPPKQELILKNIISLLEQDRDE